MKTSIIIVTRDNFRNTQLCLRALKMSQQVDIHEIIVVDNGSSEAMKAWLGKQRDLRVFFESPNKGMASAWNIGAKAATGDCLFFMHNDIFVCSNTIHRMEEALISCEVGAVGAFTNRCRYGEKYYLSQSYQDFDGLQMAVAFEESVMPLCVGTLILESHCLLMWKHVFEDVGDFDEQFDIVGFEDVDYSLRMQQNKYKLCIAGTYSYHDQNCFQENQLDEEAVYQKGREKFIQKWGTDPQYSMNVRNEFLEQLDLQKKDLTVLEVGCACGGNFMAIRSQNPNAELYGIEINPNTASVASCYATVEAVNVEMIEREDWNRKFDYILAGDVIEHLRDPWSAVKNLCRFLKIGGKLIIGVPNVLFVGNFYEMLQGNWRYRDAGILDRTHLRFFTKRSITELVESAGLAVDMIQPKMVEYDAGLLNYRDMLLKLPGVRIGQEELDAYQWVLAATLPKEDGA